MPRTSSCIGIALGIAFVAFWCGVTGIFVTKQVMAALQTWDARARFHSVPATVLASEVIVSRGSKSTSYRPRIRYRYVVDGQVHTGERYQFSDLAASGAGAWSRAVVDRYPPGSQRSAWYDPRAPGEAVLDLGFSRDYWFMWVFLQPFLVIGMGLLAAAGYVAWESIANRRCLRGACASGWHVPRLGTAAAWARGLRIGGGWCWPMAIGAVLAGHGLTCFAATFILGIAGGSGEDPWGRKPAVIAGVFAAALLAGGAVALSQRRKLRWPTVEIDQIGRLVTVSTAAGTQTAPWGGISWQVRKEVGKGRRPSVTQALFLVPTGGAEARIAGWDDRAVADHVAAELARATASGVIPTTPTGGAAP